jgi:putative sigma-54 modulation protein
VQIKISTRHGHLSEEAQELIREKASKLLHFFDRLTMIEVTIDLKKEEEKRQVELVVQAEHKHDFVARESHPDVMGAVDAAVAKLEGQIRRYKDKIQDRRRTPPAGQVTGGAPLPEESAEE